ncbi:MAG: cupredoxin domain-containing protein [Gaiellaceae bacterium]
MRSFVVSTVVLLALAAAGASRPATTVTKTVKITAKAFSPATVTIATGSAVTWTNSDTKNHQVVANNGAFASPTIAPGHSYTHTFSTAGSYSYHDALYPSLAGKVVVTGPPPAVTIGATAPILTYGQSAHVTGQVSNAKAGETVTVYAQPYGQVSPVLTATVLTGTNGVWDVVANPLLLTSYQAHWKSTVSATVSVAVRPNVLFSAAHGYGSVKVKTAGSLEGRKVYVQRFTRFDEWVKMKQVVLGRSSGRFFHLRLPRGRYVLRVFMSYNQVGAGYLDGFSRAVVYRRK